MAVIFEKDETPPIVNLQFEKGDLIIKEGDYGLSIYKILKGEVKIFRESGGVEVPLATLGPGEIFGEMTFLTRLLQPRAASARALVATELEVWHPARLSQEYEQMPSILKYIISQSLDRLKRMNQLANELTLKKQREGLQKEPEGSRRKFYRKKIDEDCTYRPVASPPGVILRGRITNASREGIGMVVRAKNLVGISHRPGEEFELSFTLPNGNKIQALGKIKWTRKDAGGRQVRLGLNFVELKGEARKNLGFFLMA
jgi:CRP-like cAMP-binding protein